MENWKKRFFTIWIGQAFSLFGSSLVDFALIWWLTETTGSERILALSSLLTLLPRMILGPFAGSLIDKVNRKTVMIAADSAIALVTVGLVILTRNGLASVPVVMTVLLLRSLGGMFHQPAMQSATALLVPEAHLPRIGGLNRILSGAMIIVAPIAGATLIEMFEITPVLCIDVVTALLAVALLAVSSVPDSPHAKEKHSVLRETADGLRYVLTTKSLFFVVGTCTLANLCCGPAGALRSLMVTSVFGGGVRELSWITAACGLGLVAGGILMSLWGGFRRNLITSGFGWGGAGIFYIAIYFLPTDGIYWLVACMFLANIFEAIGGAGLDAFYQSKVPGEYHGRVFSVLATLDNTTVPVGLVAAAVLGEAVPIRFWNLCMGILYIALFTFWAFSKTLAQAEAVSAEPTVNCCRADGD